MSNYLEELMLMEKIQEVVDFLGMVCSSATLLQPTITRQPQSKGRRAKNKGKRGEREASSFFGMLFYNDEDAFVKSPASGAWVWAGDISPNPKKTYDFDSLPICVEVKNDESLDLNDFNARNGLSQKSFIPKTLAQLVRETPEGALPFGYLTKNHKQAIVVTRPDFVEHLLNLDIWHIKFKANGLNWFGFLANDFLKYFVEKEK